MGGTFEESDRGYEATMKLYNKWLNDLGNPTNVYEANSREANENLLLDTYLTVLVDKKTVDQTRLPLDKVTGIIKDEILPIVDGEVKKGNIVPFKELSPTYQMNKKYEYSGGKTGIGPFALNNKNHILTQLSHLRFNYDSLLFALGFDGLDGINSKEEIVYKRDKKGRIQVDKNNIPILVKDESIRILDWISAMINAHVDVAKDPYVIRLNVRQYTYNICNFLLRVGYGKSTFYFLPQQILKDMAVAYGASSGIYGVDDSSSQKAVNNVRNKYYKLYEQACKDSNTNIELNYDSKNNIIAYRDISVSFNDVASNLLKRDNLIELLQQGQNFDNLSASEKVEYYKKQLLISEVFVRLNELAQDMSKLVQLSQIDTKRYGNNFIEQDRFQYRLKSLILNSALFDKDDLIEYYNSTFLRTKLINGVVTPAEIFSDMLLRSKTQFKTSVSKILSMINRIDTNDQVLNKTISNELEGSVRRRFLEDKDINLVEMFYGPNSMAKRLAKIKTDIYNGKYPEMLTQDGKISNRLLNHLGTLVKMSTDKYNAPEIITRNRISDGDKYLKNTLSIYWEELLDSPYKEIRKFGNDLFYYQLATSAGIAGRNSIFNIAPLRLIKDSGYNEYMRDAVRNFTEDNINYDDFFKNNWKNDKIVSPLIHKATKYSSITNEMEEVDAFPQLLSSNKLPNVNKYYPLIIMPRKSPIGKNSNKQDVYTPYFKIVLDKSTPEGTLLYRFIGTYEDKKGVKPIYVLTSKKGVNDSGRIVKEYDQYTDSAFDFNNLSEAFNDQYINSKTLSEVLQKNSNPNRFKNWKDIIDNIQFVYDYEPVTRSLINNVVNILDNVDLESNDVSLPNERKTVVSDKINPLIDVNAIEVNEDEQNYSNSYTFTDGFTVNIPFELNDQQKNMLSILEDFAKNPNKYDNSITISGYAGTGKTTMIGIFNKWLKANGIVPVFSSPTHRANAVTRMNNPEATIKTLHSIFGLSPLVDLENGQYDLRKMKSEQVRGPKINPGDFLIIDESSMVSETLYNFIEDFKKQYGIYIIYMGDKAQLSPVKDKDISPVFRNTKSKVELTKVERTGDNPILAESTALREGKDLSYTTQIKNGHGVEYIKTNSERIDQVINDIVSSDEYKNNPLYFRILSATNAKVEEANIRVRKQIYGDNAKQIEVGELLMGYDNISNGDSELIRNSIDYVADEVSEKKINQISVLDGKTLDVEGYEVVLRNAMTGELSEKVFVLDNNISDQKLKQISDTIEYLNRYISDLFNSHMYDQIGFAQRILSNVKKNTILMKNVTSGNALKIRKTLDYGYSHTVHKSQGGTYNKIMFYADTVNVFDEKVAQQLKYVAVSRAKEDVYIVTSNNINESVIENRDMQIEQKESNNKPINKISRATTNYNRRTVESNPRTLYIFTDNTDRTSGGAQINDGWYKDKYGNGGYGSDRNPTTAVIRGLDNAAPISTMRYFYRNHKNMTVNEARWNDKDLTEFKNVIDEEINDIKLLWDSGDFDNIVVPSGDGFFNSRIANISKNRTPKLYEYLHSKLIELNNYVNGIQNVSEQKSTVQQESKQSNSFLSRFSTFDRNAMNEMNNEGKLIADFCKGKTV